jgi:putative transcriptional regulator
MGEACRIMYVHYNFYFSLQEFIKMEGISRQGTVLILVRNNFKETIVERGMKQKFLCEKTGITTSTMSAIYNGQIPLLENALKIAKVLGLKIEDIWSLED